MKPSIVRALPVIKDSRYVDMSNATVLGIGEILMFADGTTLDKEGRLVFHQAVIDNGALRDLLWTKAGNGSTTITIPGVALKGELVVVGGLISFGGVNYRKQPGRYTDYVCHMV